MRPLAIESIESQLERVQAAIAAIEAGAQDYMIGSRRVTRGDLATLYKRERELLQQYYEEKYGSIAYAAGSGWPTK